jgi:hypothetical protein
MINKTTKQKSTDRATQSPLETGRELWWSGRVGSCYSTFKLYFDTKILAHTTLLPIIHATI